ncbi:hypothetical protein [Dyadobacter sp. CY323]|uniref:hypothetical protein n=1 Tax=Dyadobacter sp. CY323 TaxID=2907302 RepID=UPI001F3D419E|nr:hypothetical protein [Dyadobacter sp. CY323]MCE6992436.1 hypothetical protein [Dyadobacter sp. CY323]
MGTEENKNENLSKLLRAAGEERAPFHFSEHVLKGIQTELQIQAATEWSLKLVLMQNAIEQPSADFGVNLIHELTKASSVHYKPIISVKTWFGIAAAVTLLLLAGYLFPSSTPAAMPQFLAFLGKRTPSILAIPDIQTGTLHIGILTLIGLSALILADYFFRNKFSVNNKLARS